MTETNARPQPAAHPRLPALHEDGLPAFLVDAQQGLILAANPAAARLGLGAGALASAAVIDLLRAAARRSAQGGAQAPCLVRLRPPYDMATQTFRCTQEADGTVLFTTLSADTAPPLPAPAPMSAPLLSEESSAPLRFNFEADGDGRLLWIAPALAEALGAQAPHFIGASFAELEAAGLVQGAAAAQAALTGGGSFSGVRLALSDAAPFDPPYDLELGGVPLRGAGRAPTGVRGFGIAWPRLRPRREAPPAEEPAPPAPPRRDIPVGGDGKVVALRTAAPLTATERSAFQEIARTLSAAVEGWQSNVPAGVVPLAGPAGWPFAGEAARPPQPFPPQEADSSEAGLLNRLPVALLVQQNGELVHANGTFHHWTGYEDLDAFARSGGLAGALERDADGQLRLVTASGAQVPVEVRLLAAPFRGHNALVYVVRRLDGPPPAFAQDERHRERAMARREALHLVPWPVLLLEADGHVLFANGAATRLLEMEEHALMGALFLLAVAPQDHPAAVAALNRALDEQGGAPIIETLDLLTGSGGLARVRAAFGQGGTEDRLVCLVLAPQADLEPMAPEALFPLPVAAPEPPPPPPTAEPEEPTDQIAHLARLLTDQLAAPLALLLSGAPAEAEALSLSDDARAALARIRSELEDLSALAASAPPTQEETCDLAQIAGEALDHLTPSARRRGVRLRADLCPAAPVAGHGPRLARLVRLLLEDALAHSPAGTGVAMSLEQDDDGTIHLAVGDAGVALDEVAAARARDPLRASPRPEGPEPGDARGAGLLRWARLEREATDLGGTFTVQRGLSQGHIAGLWLPGPKNS